MLLFYEVETGDMLKDLFQKGWQSWAGAPVEVLLDPARTNLASSFVDPLELHGRHSSAEHSGRSTQSAIKAWPSV
jgi:hypothetical protein